MLMASINEKAENLEAEKSLFIDRFKKHIDSSFTGGLKYSTNVVCNSESYGFGLAKCSKYNVGFSSTDGKLLDYISEWIKLVLKELPCFVKQNVMGVSKGMGNGDWNDVSYTRMTIAVSEKYIEMMKNDVNKMKQPAVSNEKEQTPGNDDVIIDNYPCGICENSSNERILTHCSKGNYHASFCVKCFEDEKAACVICNTIPDRMKCKVIKLR